jgi:hypothetical protein
VTCFQVKYCTDGAERSPTSKFPSKCYAFAILLITNAGIDNHVISLATDKHFGLVYIGHRGLEWNTTVGEKGEVSSIVFPAIHETSFRGLPIFGCVIGPQYLSRSWMGSVYKFG